VFLYPTPELSDDTPIEDVRFSARIRRALIAAGIMTVGEIREASDKTLLIPNPGSRDSGRGIPESASV
jgi:DNA-directed RNA polymerase alpha subunit